jgi:cation diffusion facilitator family transporter
MQEEEGAKEKKRAAALSALAAFFLTSLKLGAGLYSNSLGVLAEAAHSALDLLAAGITFWAVRQAARPADSRHAYGHGKAENLAALAETLILLFTCGWIMHEAIQRFFFHPEPVRMKLWAILVLGLSILVDFNRSRILRRLARKHNSQALAADALHFSTDMLSSAVVIIGLGAVWAAEALPHESQIRQAMLRADALAAVMVAILTAKLSLSLGKEAVDVLLDAGSAERMRMVEEAVNSVPEVLRLERLRLRESGPVFFIDMLLVMRASSSLESAHAVTEKVEKAVLDVLPGADLTIHFEPEERRKPNLMAIVQKTALRHGLDAHAVTLYKQMKNAGEKFFITLHAAVPGDMPLAEAHRRADAFEQSLRGECGHEILTHLEPRLDEAGEDGHGVMLALPDAMEGTLLAVMEQILTTETQVSLFHRPRLMEVAGRLDLSLHCHMPGNTPIYDCHQSIHRIEGLIMRAMPQLSRVTIHADVLEDCPPKSDGR